MIRNDSISEEARCSSLVVRFHTIGRKNCTVISENKTKRLERNTKVKNICVCVSVHSHVTSYCILPLGTNAANRPDCWLAVVASPGMLST